MVRVAARSSLRSSGTAQDELQQAIQSYLPEDHAMHGQ